jgi:gamma-glutamylcyclotransferase
MTDCTYYFAYGSNMSSVRIRERVPNARAIGPASWPGMRLTCNQVARDGSGKANLVVDPALTAWGVIYELQSSDWSILDRFEPGYRRRLCSIRGGDGTPITAQVYLGMGPFGAGLPCDWYRDHLLLGAREFGLPGPIIELILSFDTRSSKPHDTAT